MKRRRRPFRFVVWAAILGIATAIVVAGVGWLVERRQAAQARPYLTAALARLPTFEVGLVLGTGPLTYWRDGRITPNIPFAYRLDAAAALWRAGKVRYLIVSGNRTGDYDEATAMRSGLIARGVPADVVYRDFSGFRTNDSILRARSIFGLKRAVIVSQAAHLERAVFLAHAAGLDAWGFEAREETQRPPDLAFRAYLIAAALRAQWDVTVATPAREGGAPIAIGVDPPN